MIATKYSLFIVPGLLLIALAACVERTITIHTDPPGALVTVNEMEKGRTPLTFPFMWYGRYRVLVEHPQYETLETSRAVPTPIYQWPGIDFVCEVLLPFKFHNHHDWDFTLVPRRTVPTDELIDRAEDFRRQAQTATEPDRK